MEVCDSSYYSLSTSYFILLPTFDSFQEIDSSNGEGLVIVDAEEEE
jgi:hypothetical protein